MAGRILVVSAFPPEQAFLLEMAQRFPSHRFDFVLCGIGPVRAATAVSAALATSKFLPERVVFCGTAGAFSSQVRIGSAVRVQRARATDAGAILGQSYIPAQKQPYEELVSPLATAPSSICLCPPSITRDRSLAEKLATLGAFENLELFGVATAATAAQLRWEAFLGISNYVGPEGHSQWKQNHREASKAAGELLWRSLFS